MDVYLEVLEENIYAQDTKSVRKIVKNYLKNKYNVKRLLEMLVNIHSKSYADNNIYNIKQVLNYVKSSDCMSLACFLSDRNQIDVIGDYATFDVRSMVFNGYTYQEELDDLKDILSEDVYIYFNILWENMIKGISLNQSMNILRHLLSLNKKKYFKGSEKHDTSYYILVLLYNVAKKIDKELFEYIVCCKDLYFYGAKKYRKRQNLLYLCLRTIHARKIVNEGTTNKVHNPLYLVTDMKSHERMVSVTEENKYINIIKDNVREKESSVHKQAGFW